MKHVANHFKYTQNYSSLDIAIVIVSISLHISSGSYFNPLITIQYNLNQQLPR